MQNPFTQKDQENEDYLLAGEPPAPGFDPASGLPPQTPPPLPMPPMPPPPPNDLHDFQAQQRAGMQKYGPEQQMAVEQDIAKRRGSLGSRVANAGAGFADALMQGVARAGPSNFQGNLQSRNDKTDEGLRSAMEKAQTGKMAQMKGERELAQDDPTSPLSRSAQRAAAPLFKAMGMSDEEIANIPASLAAQAQTGRLSLEEIRAKADETRALREQTGIYQGEMIKNTRRGQAQTAVHQEAEQRAAVKKSRMDAATEVLKRSGNAHVFGVPIPFTSDVSGKDQKAAQKVLVEGMSPSEGVTNFQTEEEAAAAGLPPGTEIKIGGRRARIK